MKHILLTLAAVAAITASAFSTPASAMTPTLTITPAVKQANPFATNFCQLCPKIANCLYCKPHPPLATNEDDTEV
jgi:hypothetical protein